MFHNQGAVKNSCNVLTVLCGERTGSKQKQNALGEKQTYPVSSGRLEVQTLKNPTKDEFRKVLDSWKPNLVYIQGQLLRNDKIGSLVWRGSELSDLFSSTRPATVYLELANGERLAKSLHFKGIPYVIYWKSSFSCQGANHFRHALFSAVQSSPCHTWDAFQLAHASYRLHCLRNDVDQVIDNKLTPNILGEAPKINADIPDIEPGDDYVEESSSGSAPAIKIYDDHMSMKFLVCGTADSLDASLLGSLEDGLNALLSIEMRESKLHNRASALSPPLEAGTFSRDVVTMRCDISTSSSARISLLVSGSAQTCFDDQLLEKRIKNEIIENSHLVHAPPNSDDNRPPISEPRRSIAVACGAPVFEVCMKVPSWASQVLRQLAHDISYRALVALGIASVQGVAVSSFEKEDADRLLFFCKKQDLNNLIFNDTPAWLRPPPPSRKRQWICQETSFVSPNGQELINKGPIFSNAISRKNIKVAAMRPIPHIHPQKMLPFSRISSEASKHNGNHVKANLPITPPTKHNGVGSAPITHTRTSVSGSKQAKQIVSLNPRPLKEHNCGRSPLHVCTEEEFLKDVMQFLILRGHSRLIPQGGIAEFPDVILNTKRLDLFNLYREVVTRGGFHVGNGINWKGQVFSKMRNHTATNRMTGVGNALKRHYETYLLEYELAHDDVEGECCLMCRSGAPGDWVNCGLCGEWAHFGCDRRPGLGTFKDYAKAEGLDYICPHCSSASNHKKKVAKPTDGYP